MEGRGLGRALGLPVVDILLLLGQLACLSHLHSGCGCFVSVHGVQLSSWGAP